MEATGRPCNDFAVLHPARLLSFDPDMTLDMKDDGRTYILGFKSHPCVFLGKGNKCAIHNSAPLSCKRFPFVLTDSLNTRFCPLLSQLIFRLKGSDLAAGQMAQELDAYKKMVRKWNSNPGKIQDCIPFLLEQCSH